MQSGGGLVGEQPTGGGQRYRTIGALLLLGLAVGGCAGQLTNLADGRPGATEPIDGTPPATTRTVAAPFPPWESDAWDPEASGIFRFRERPRPTTEAATAAPETAMREALRPPPATPRAPPAD